MLTTLRKKIFRLFFPHANISYSQSGEDILLTQHIFQHKKDGFYIDIGAHHPKRFSNTYLLYQQGWSGINIDPIPGMKKLFSERKRDINIHAGVSDKTGMMKYYAFTKGAVNTFEEAVAKEQEVHYGKPHILDVPVLPLVEILDTHASHKKINLLNIDVEGHEIPVLKSNNWFTYAPEIITIEDQGIDLANPTQSDTYCFLKEKGYILFNKTNYTTFYRKQ